MVRISEKRLLELLQKNARLSFTEIAKKLGVTEGAVRKRVKALEKEGVIKGYHADVEPTAMARKVDTVTGVDTTPEGFLSIIDLLKKDKHVVHLWSSTGGHMIMFRTFFKDSRELYSFVKKLEKDKRVLKVCPAILVEKLK